VNLRRDLDQHPIRYLAMNALASNRLAVVLVVNRSYDLADPLPLGVAVGFVAGSVVVLAEPCELLVIAGCDYRLLN